MSKFITRQDAINHMIINPINEGDNADNYDIEAIADIVLGDYADGYEITVDEMEFWDIVADKAL